MRFVKRIGRSAKITVYSGRFAVGEFIASEFRSPHSTCFTRSLSQPPCLSGAGW